MNESIEKRLAWLAKNNGGTLTPDLVVRDAMNKTSPLHGEFEWDKSKAAWAHWLARAREIIRSVRIVVHDDRTTVSVVAYVHDPRCLPDEQGYLSTIAIRSDQELAREALAQEFSRAAAYLKRARDLAVAFSLDAEVEDLQTRLTVLREQIARDARAS